MWCGCRGGWDEGIGLDWWDGECMGWRGVRGREVCVLLRES